MAGRTNKPTAAASDTPQQETVAPPQETVSSDAPQETIRTQQYEGGTGWRVGQYAPTTMYRQLDDDGQPTGEPVAEGTKRTSGRWIQAVHEGSPVTEDVLRTLGKTSDEMAAFDSGDSSSEQQG